jgi:hypothetical protein
LEIFQRKKKKKRNLEKEKQPKMLIHVVHGEGKVHLANASCRLAAFVPGLLRACVDPETVDARGVYAVDLVDAAAAASGCVKREIE